MNTKICPLCSAPIPANAPGGFCPACLLRDAQEPVAMGRSAPSLEEVAEAFPQLEILGLIGQGGMGFVYKARQPNLERLVALKILSPELGRDPAFAERFAREARVLGKLNHPNIVTVFEHGRTSGYDGTGGGFFYLLMEFVDGVNLREAMRAGRFTPQQALAVVPGICEALQAAHSQGIWHRDIKPENILLDARGGVKIADFGIARIAGNAARDFTLTPTGGALGSAAYMAPEQHEKPHDVDHRADIYSLGVVIYEMLTGELPLGRFPAPSARAAVNARIDAIVLQTLEKERALRQQSAAELKTQVATLDASASTAPAASVPQALFADARKLVAAPARGLMIASGLNVLLYGAWLCFLTFFVHWQSTPTGDVATYTGTGHSSWSMTMTPGMGVHPGLTFLGPVLALSLLTFIGAWRMRRLRGYGLAIAAAILGIFTPPGMFLGVIFGLWALIVLLRREVRDAFEPFPTDVRRRVVTPAHGLMAASLFNLLLLGRLLFLALFVAHWETSPEGDVLTYRGNFTPWANVSVNKTSPGGETLTDNKPAFTFKVARHPAVGMHPALLTIVPAVAILALVPALGLLGAWRMRRLRGYRLAGAAALFTMLTPPGMFFGWIFAIWALVVLSKNEVKAAFDGGKPRPLRGSLLIVAGATACVFLLFGAWYWAAQNFYSKDTGFNVDFHIADKAKPSPAAQSAH